MAKTPLEEIKELYHKNDKIAGELVDEWFRLQLEWLDKIITLSVSIISVTITIILAVKGKSEYWPLENFFWMWLAFAISALLCLLARVSYSNIRFCQGGLLRTFQKHIRTSYYELWSSTVDDTEYLSPQKTDIIDLSGGNVKIWRSIAYYASLNGLIFFIIGIFVFICIGHSLIT